MLARLRLPCLGGAARWLSGRGGGGKPRINELQTVKDVLLAHRGRKDTMQSADLSTCWNKMGKLVRQDPAERSWLRTELRRRAAPLERPSGFLRSTFECEFEKRVKEHGPYDNATAFLTTI